MEDERKIRGRKERREREKVREGTGRESEEIEGKEWRMGEGEDVG